MLLLAVAAVLARWMLGRRFLARLGVGTGDWPGAVQQVTEAAFLPGLLAVLTLTGGAR